MARANRGGCGRVIEGEVSEERGGNQQACRYEGTRALTDSR